MPSRSRARRPRPRKAMGGRMRRRTRTTTTTGRIPRPFSSKGPFPLRMNTQLVYKAPSTNVTSAGINSYNYCNFALNSMFDFDQTNIIGNKQSLFYDQLLSADGPYKNYKVNAWKTVIRFINLSDKAMFVYYDPTSGTLITDTDSAAEMQNRRGVQSFTLTAQANSKPMVTIKKFQTLKSFFPNSINSSENFSAAWNTGPAIPAYSALGWQTIDGSVAAFTIAIQVQHIFYCTLFNADSTAS